MISLLYEHKSNPGKYTLFQVGGYIFDAYNQQITNKTNPLKLVIPIIYYHGGHKWNPGNIDGHFSNLSRELLQFLPGYEYIFQNLSELTDEEIWNLEHKLLVPGLLMQKHFRDLNLMKDLVIRLFQLVSQLPEDGNFKQRSYVYLLDILGVDKKNIMSTIQDLERFTQDKTQNYILQLMYKGREEGREEGKEVGKEEGINIAISISKLLHAGHSTEYICAELEVEPELVERIKKEMEG